MAKAQDEPTILLDETDFAEPGVNEEGAAAPAAPPESPPVETNPETPEPPAPPAEPAPPEGTPPEGEETPPPADPAAEEGDEPPKGKGAEARKQKLEGDIEEGKKALGIDPNTEIRDLVGARNAIRQAVEQQTAGAYQPQTVEELQEEGLSETDARLASMEQKQELTEYNNKVSEAQLFISSESNRVLSEFPMFNPMLNEKGEPTNPAFKPAIAAQAADILEASLIRDPNVPEIIDGKETGKGIVIGATVSPYVLYKTINDASQAAAVENQIAGQKATERMQAAADGPSSAVPAEPKEDPFFTGLTQGLNLPTK